MPIYLTARNPTGSVTEGLLPAAARLGLEVVLLTDHPDEHAAAYLGRRECTPPLAIVPVQVFDAGAVATRVTELSRRFGRPAALFSNSDHLQTATALAAELLGLPGKPWHAALRCKNKLLTRQTLAEAGLDVVQAVEITPDDDPDLVADVVFPAVVKPREGVASEDVVLVRDRAELLAAVSAIRRNRPGCALLVEEYLAGPLRTYDTIGDARGRYCFGSWRTTLADPPCFTETRLDWAPELPVRARAHVEAQLDALDVGFGACHTEFVLQDERARIVEVNYRLIGDAMDLISAELLGVDLFDLVIRVHCGEPLPEGLPDPGAACAHARVDYVLAGGSGTFVDAPPEGVLATADGVRLGHRRLRAPGSTREVRGNNRDYLAAIYGYGQDGAAVGAAVETFRDTHAWVVEPAPTAASVPVS